MFSKKIRETRLTDNIADDFFKISGDSYNNDKSFLATMRALLYKRSRDAAVRLFISAYGCTGYSDAGFTSYDEIFDLVFRRNVSNGLFIRYLSGGTDDCATVFKMFDDPNIGFVKWNPDFHEAKDLSVFVMNRGRFNARFYVNEQNKATVILCDGFSLCEYHLLQSITPRFFPWFFKELPLDEVEISLLDSLTYHTSSEYERIITQLADQFDFREYTIKKIVGDFEKAGLRAEAEDTRRSITSIRSDIDDINRRYQSYIKTLNDLNMRLNGQEMALQTISDSSELVDYFVCNRNLDPIYVDGRRLSFTVKTFFEAFDPEQYRTYITKTTSFLYTGYDYLPEFASPEIRRRFMDAIFSDEPILKVKMCANYSLDLRGMADAMSHYEYGIAFRDYVPNPHIQHYACLGNYRPYIQNMLLNGNIVGAIEQCIASAKSLNFAEAHTVRYFLGDVFNNRNKIIRLPDGRDVTPIEALEYLNSLDETKEEQNV